MTEYQQNGPLIHRVDGDRLIQVGLAADLRRHVRRASERLDGSGDPDRLVAELRRWAAEDAPNAGGRRNALAAAAWLDGTSVSVA